MRRRLDHHASEHGKRDRVPPGGHERAMGIGVVPQFCHTFLPRTPYARCGSLHATPPHTCRSQNAGAPPTAPIWPATPVDFASAISGAGPGDTLQFSCDDTITLSSTIELSKDLTIDGNSHAVTISGGKSVRVFLVDSGVDVTLSEL